MVLFGSAFVKRVSALMASVIALSAVISVFPADIDNSIGVLAADSQGTDTVDAISVDPTGRGEGYSAVLYDNTSGLPTSEANAIVQTDEGFIWIGSYSGLIRYDGNTFERIDSTTGIASVMSLFVDSKNRLWVGTNDSGAAVMEKGEFRMFNHSDGLESLSVRSITEDSEGNIYLATTLGLAVVDKDQNLQMLNDPKINNEYVRMLRVCDDVIYGVTKEGSVFTVEDKKLTAFYSASKLGISNIHSVLPDPEKPGYVYIGNQGSELYYGKLSGGFTITKTIDISPLNYINSVELVGDMIWVCTDSGIGFVHNDSFVPVSNIPMTTSVEGMMTDYQRNLWFVSSQQGVMKIVPNQFSDLFEKYHLESEVVYSTCTYNDKLFVGTKNSGLIVLQGDEQLTSLPIKSSVSASGVKYEDTDLLEMMQSSKIRSIIRDSKNRLWFSTFGSEGIVRYDNGNVVRFTVADGLPSDRIRAVYECDDGSMLAACTGGVAVIKDDKVTDVYGDADGINNTEVLTAVEGSDGDIVIGTDGGGIYIINGSKITHYGTDDGLSSDVVMRVKKDIKREIFWIVTSNSIAYMTADHKITTISNFPYSNNFDLYENSSGEIWVLSSNGIYVTDVEQLLANEEITTLYYGKDNGLPCIATSNSYSELTEDGDLYMAGTTGIAKVNIENAFDNVSDIKMAVPYIDADGQSIYPKEDGSFVIPASTKKLTIYCYVYSYSLMNPQVSYHLDGFDKNTATVKRSDLVPISYTNLSGGKYHFILQIEDPHGQSSKELSVLIRKQKSFFEKIWVRIICVLVGLFALAILVTVFIHIRTRRYLKKANEQKQLIREIVEAFAKVVDMKDKYTNGHSTRVADYTALLTKELGYDDEIIEKYYNIALMHDIGKIGVPPEVLNKPGKLTDEEFAIIKSHSALGYNALKDISIMPELAIGAGAHHERPDGKGYPKGLKGEEIPRVAQIIAVADTFDAMYSDRPYRKRMNFEKVVSIMKEVRGTQLTSDVVDAFLRLVDKGEFRDPNDDGGGSTEDIDNIHKRLNKENKQDKKQ